MKTIKLTLAAIAVMTATWLPNNASAWMKFCNKTSKPIFVNLVMPTSQCSNASYWGGYGWYSINSCQCANVTSEALAPGWTYYYYARSHDSSLIWSGGGNQMYWMPGAAHTPWCLWWPNGSSGDARSHRPIAITSTNQTVNLATGPGGCCDQGPGCHYSGDQCLCGL